MEYRQAHGYVFEVIIQELLSQSGYYKVKSGEVEGRGAKHQIDAFGIYSYPVPYIYPIRIISEVKCYKSEKIGLPSIRNFVGVMKDISERYFIVNGSRNEKDRYNEIGCFFSATDFTKDAQNYAWAQNIFLVSFYKNALIDEIIKGIDSFLSDFKDDNQKINLSKNMLVEEVKKYLHGDIQNNSYKINSEKKSKLLESFNLVSLRIGVLDNRYPVILVGKRDWDKRIEIDPNSDSVNVIKRNRRDHAESSTFYLELKMDIISFNLPKNIRNYLISIINKSNNGENIFSIDLPVIDKDSNNEAKKHEVRRILRLDVKL